MRLFLLCCILLQSTLLFSQNPLELQAVILPSDLKENSDSIIRDEQITVNIPDQRTLEHTVYRVITVLNKKGMSDINAIAYYDKDSRVKKLEATIYNNIGEEIKKIKCCRWWNPFF
jgi:hypothetical protein